MWRWMPLLTPCGSTFRGSWMKTNTLKVTSMQAQGGLSSSRIEQAYITSVEHFQPELKKQINEGGLLEQAKAEFQWNRALLDDDVVKNIHIQGGEGCPWFQSLEEGLVPMPDYETASLQSWNSWPAQHQGVPAQVSYQEGNKQYQGGLEGSQAYNNEWCLEEHMARMHS